MKIEELGEFELIEKISALFKTDDLGPQLGIGDDCSVVEFNETYYQIMTTDLLIEDVHFLRDKIFPEELGAKAIEVNVSDIAAMGGFPETAYLCLGIPKGMELNYIEKVFLGLKKSCDKYQIKLMGGDTTKSPNSLVINILLQGKVEKSQVKLRSSAKAGDIICVTGELGDSGIGLSHLLGKTQSDFESYFVCKHHRPSAHLAQGRWLSPFSEVHAMMDISDGIASDLKHICKNSEVGAEVDLESLPLSAQAKALYQKEQNKLEELALTGGEDYVLLLTVAASKFALLQKNFEKEFGTSLTQIGIATEGNQVLFKRQGCPVKISAWGFDHFRKSF